MDQVTLLKEILMELKLVNDNLTQLRKESNDNLSLLDTGITLLDNNLQMINTSINNMNDEICTDLISINANLPL